MPAFVKTDKDEELWSKAKARAKEQGRAKDWAYITGIFKSMKGGKVAAYSEDFLEWAAHKWWIHPTTRNRVKFDSLPAEEKKKVHAQWENHQAWQAHSIAESKKPKKKPKPPKKPKFDKVPGISEKRQRKMFDDIVDGVVQQMFDPYHGGIYSAEGIVEEVDETGRPTKVTPVSLHGSVDKDDSVAGVLSEGDLKGIPPAERKKTLQALYKSLFKALRGYEYDTEIEIAFRPDGKEKPGRVVHQDGDTFERGYSDSDLRMKVPVRIKIKGVGRDKYNESVRVTADSEMLDASDSNSGKKASHVKESSMDMNAKWKNRSAEKKAAARKAFAPSLLEEEEVVLLPADVKRVSAERMRDLGRALMIAGTRPPRPQMVSIAVTLDGLLEQLKMLGDQNPGLNAMRRRILLGLRGKVLGG